jgi:two-component system, OmpR family, alkaline phosphatase synthesis response regulator PhoP
MRTVLIIEDDQAVARLIRDYLEKSSFAVITSADGEAGLIRARADKPEAVVLDLGLPGRDGLDTLREIRRFSNMPIVIVTARGDETDRVIGLELGADDYIVKPFSPREMVARVRAVLRRSERTDAPQEQIRIANLTLDIPRMRADRNGEIIDLTPTEFQLLVTLASAPGRVFTRNQLLDAVHGVAFESYERAVDAHIKNIRRKLELVPSNPTYILTVHGVGYRFADDRA